MGSEVEIPTYEEGEPDHAPKKDVEVDEDGVPRAQPVNYDVADV